MPNDQDELDQLLRGAMKTLDDQVPSGYFEGLPRQTLTRLEGSAMTQTTAAGTDPNASFDMSTIDMSHVDMKPTESGRIHAETENAVPRDEDSGLHDIRSLAQSTKQRLSSKITAVRPDEDILATSSASWKNIALPEPARMVALPEIGELPSKQEVRAKEKVAKADKKAAAAPPLVIAAAAPARVDAIAPATPVAAVESAPSSMIGSRIAAKANKGNGTKTLVFVGLGLAAAAGVTFFVMSQNSNDTSKGEQVALQSAAPAPPTVAPVPPKEEVQALAAAPEQKLDEAAAGSAAPTYTATTAPAADIAAPAAKAREKSVTKGAAAKPKADEPEAQTPAKDTKKAIEKPGAPVAKGDGTEPSFDDLLKEAGVKDKQADKPKLEKKSLSSDDIKRGMGAVAGKAQACFAGTQGTAAVKLTVTPDGKVSKVSVGGPFANTPVGECVANAVRSTSFPAWEGGPQSFGYSYLLEEK